MRGRSGQVLGIGGRHERQGSVARTTPVAFAVLCGATRVRGQVARLRTSQRGAGTAAAATRLVRSSGRAATAAIGVTAGTPLSVRYVATPATAAATAAAQPQQQQLRDVGDGRGRYQVRRGRRRRRSHRPVVRHVRLPSPPPRTATASPPSRSRRLPAPAPARWRRQPIAQLATGATAVAAAVRLSRRHAAAPTAPTATVSARLVGFRPDETLQALGRRSGVLNAAPGE